MNKTNIYLLIFILSLFTVNILAQETVPKTGHTGTVQSVAFSPDGKQIISCSDDDKYIRIWDVATGQEIKTLLYDHFENKYIRCVKLSPDGKQIISSSIGIIKIWDRNTGKELKSINEFFNEFIISLDITPDGKQIAALYHNTTSPGLEDIFKIRFFDITTGERIPTFLWYIEKVTSFAFSPDGSRIITGSFDDGAIKIWDAFSEKELKTISEDLYRVNFIAFSPDGKYFITRSEIKYGHYISIWDADTYMKKKDISINTDFGAIVINQDGSLIATIPYRKINIQLIDTATGKDVKTMSNFSGHTDYITCLAFSPDGKMIVSGSRDKSVKLWDVATGQEIRTMGKSDSQ